MCRRNASITVAGLALGGLLLAGSPAGAQTYYAPYGPTNAWSGHTNSGWGGNTYDPRVDHRQEYQQDRIQQGINSGSLTPGETRYLEREQGRIDRAEDRMSADGNLSPRERQRLNQMQNQASRDIYRMENNNRTAGGYGNQAGWQGRDHDGDRREYGRDHDRGWDRRDDGWQGQDRDGDGRNYSRQGDNRGWDGRDNGWHGNNPVAAGHTPGEMVITRAGRVTATPAGRGITPVATATRQAEPRPMAPPPRAIPRARPITILAGRDITPVEEPRQVEPAPRAIPRAKAPAALAGRDITPVAEPRPTAPPPGYTQGQPTTTLAGRDITPVAAPRRRNHYR